MYKIFQNQINQVNTGDVFGKLLNSFNCDLTYNVGKLGLAQRTIITTNSSDATLEDLGCPVGFKYFDSRWFTVAGDKIFSNGGVPVGAFAEDTTPASTFSSDYADLENFNSTTDNVLLFASNDKLWSKASDGSGTGAFTNRRTFSGVNQNHPICTYNNRAYWLDIDSKIYSMDNAFSVSTSSTFTLVLPNEYKVIWMRSYSNGIMIGTMHKFGGEGLVFDWDGVTANKWNRAYKVYAQGALAGYVQNDVPFVMNSNGVLLKFNGGGFTKVAKFPPTRDLLYKATNLTTNDRFIHPNGLTSVDGRICALINSRLNNTTTVSYADNIHAGIWEYTEDSGWYHKFSLSYRTRPDSGGNITDYGQMTLSRVGGLAETPDIFGTAETLKGNFLAGATFFTDASNTANGIWTDSYYDEVTKAGFFTTTQLRASHIEEMWNKVTLLYTPSTGNKFVVKYRATRDEHVDFDITWVDIYTFTTTQNVSIGDEITIIQGKGSGRIAHVESVSGTGTYTVRLDEQNFNVTGTARARKQSWKKIGSIDSETAKYSEHLIGNPDTVIEIKVAVVGTGDNVLVDELVLDNTRNK